MGERHSYSPGYQLLFHINYASDGRIQNALLYKDIKHVVIIKKKKDPFQRDCIKHIDCSPFHTLYCILDDDMLIS